MSDFQITREIQAPVSLVYHRATDLARLTETIPAITRVEVVSPGPEGRFGVGTRWRETRKAMGKEITLELWVSACEPDRTLSVEAELMNTRYTTRFDFVPGTGGTGTSATLRCTATPRSIMARLMVSMTKPAMLKGMKSDLDCLAIAAESDARA